MKKATLVSMNRSRQLASLCLAMAGILAVCRPAWAAGTFGSVIPLPGHISEIVLDEPRAALYAANFSAGHVDVISTSSNRLISSIDVGRSPSGLALSPDGQYLVVTNYNNLGVPTISSVTVVNLNDLSRQNFAISNPPLAVAFGADGQALIITTVDVERFRPNGGTFEVVTKIESLGQFLPVPAPTFPREITKASMTASGDGNYIFGLSESFMFTYTVTDPPVMNVRLTNTLFEALQPPLITASFDGSYFMAGQFLLDRRLRVMAQFPDSVPTQVNLGGHAIDFGLRRVYASYPESVQGTTAPIGGGSGTTGNTGGNAGTGSGGSGTGSGSGGTTTTTLLPPSIVIQDADNLTIRDRIRLQERVTGRMVLGGGGRYLYAVSESGITYLPLVDLAATPQIRPATEQVLVQFDFCQRNSVKQQIRIDGNTDFKIISNIGAGRDQGNQVRGVSFNPSEGTAPAVVEMTVDFTQFSKVQGTTHAQILVKSQNAVNEISPIALEINVKDADQRGRLVPIPGKLVDILPDPRRDQFYVLEQTKNEVHAFQNSDLSLLGTFKTGNRPTWMSFSPDRRYLLIANSAGENLTVINLDTMQSEGYLFLVDGDSPVSVASDNTNTLVVVRRSDGPARIDLVDAPRGATSVKQSLGIYTNQVHDNTAMVPLPNLNGVFIVEADGNVKLWDAASRSVILARKAFDALKGTIAAGPSVLVADNNIMNMSLVPQGKFAADAPNVAAGFTFMGEAAVRTTGLSGAVTDTGTVQKVDVRTPTVRRAPVRMVEAPMTPLKFPFIRSLAALRNGSLVSTSTTGLVELPGNFDAGIAIPRVAAITSAADFSDALAPGSLVTIFGQNLATDTASAGSLPLPTSLANVCVTVNGLRLPLLYASPGQINGQLPFEVMGQSATVLHTPGGLSDIYYADVQTAAPSVFQVSVDGQSGKFPAIVRDKNGQLATLSNPLHRNENFTVYLTGLGDVGPEVEPGAAAPASPLSASRVSPQVFLGGRQAGLYYAGLAPGFVGVYQVNGKVPGDATPGMQIPLTIAAGASSTTVNVRIVE